MFSVIFEVFPNRENWDDYLDNAEMLRPELEQVEGFVDIAADAALALGLEAGAIKTERYGA